MKQLARSALAILLAAALLLSLPVLAAGDADTCFSSQLSELGTQIYDRLTSPEGMQALAAGDGIQFTFDNYSGEWSTLGDAAAEAFSALQLTHVELFWVDGYSTSIRGNSSQVTLTLKPTFCANWADGSRSVAEDRALLNSAVEKLAAEAAAQGGVYEQLLYVHDWLTTNNEYNEYAADYGDYEVNYLPWSPLSALTDLDKPVCEGYARAFKLVCDALGIPCIVVCGDAWGPHAWNQVQLNGKWYGVDVTFDDPLVNNSGGKTSGHESHDYFLIGANSHPLGNYLFSDTHIPDEYSYYDVALAYPPLAAEAYDPKTEPAPTPAPTPTPTPTPEPTQAPEPIPEPTPAPQAGLANFTRANAYSEGMFSDVPASAWYAENVKTAYELGLMVGSGSGFNPTGDLTVAEALVLACRLHSIYSGDGASFTQGSPWYQVYVDYAVENGIIRPDRYDYRAPATRLEFAEILGAALPEEALPAINTVPDGSIPDVADNRAVYRLYRAGILTGNDEFGTFQPDSSIQRSAVAAIVTRMAVPELRRSVSLKPLPVGDVPAETPVVPAPQESGTIFDYLVSYLAREGEAEEDGYYCLINMDESFITGLSYDRGTDLLTLSCIFTDFLSGVVSISTLDFDRALTQPFRGEYVIYWDEDGDGSYASASIDASSFRFDPDDPVAFDEYQAMDEDYLFYFEGMFTADICICLLELQEYVLDPAGYSLTDLGFALYWG